MSGLILKTNMAETPREEESPEPISPEEVERRRREELWLNSDSATDMMYSIEDIQNNRKFYLLGILHKKADIDLAHSVDKEYSGEDYDRINNDYLYIDGKITREELENNPRSHFLDFDNPYRYALNGVLVTDGFFNSGGVYPWAEDMKKDVRDSLRDIFGNPFAKEQPVLNPEWRTSTVLGVAEAIYEDKAFDRMPILADALEDAGCDNSEILSHCRSDDCPHVRGCWVIDLILGKE